MESLANVYEEVCMLELKYQRLVNVCKLLLHPWPDRDKYGKTKKEQRQKEPKGKQDSCSHDKGVQIDCHPHRDEGREMVDLQALDNILCKAQRIRDQSDKIKKVRATTTTSIAMATLAYGQSKPLPNKKAISKSKPAYSSSKVFLNKPNTSVSETRPHPPLTKDSNETEQDTFSLQANGQRLSMMSRYSKLKHLLTRMNKQQTVSHSATSEVAKHFTHRLLSQECVGQSATIETMLAVEEFAIFRDELLNLSSKELAVCDKQEWQDLLRLKTKLDTILTRVVKLSTRASPSTPLPSTPLVASDACNDPSKMSLLHPFNCIPASEQFWYVELKKLKQLCLLERQLVFEKWELQFVEFIGETVIPLLQCNKVQRSSADVCQLLQCVHKLLSASHSETTVSYVLVDQ